MNRNDRSKLLKYDTNALHTFVCTFDRIATKEDPHTGRIYVNTLLIDIKNKDLEYLAQHIWFRNFPKNSFKHGDRVIIKGRIHFYWKGFNRDIKGVELVDIEILNTKGV